MGKSRNYFYKGNTYEVLGDCLMKDSEKNWIEAVRYKDVNADYKGEFVRSKKQFNNRFIPATLEIGDKVMIISHGKFVGVTEVVDINGDFCSLEKSIGDAPKTLPREVNHQGFILTNHHWEFYVYNETTCKAREFVFKGEFDN